MVDEVERGAVGGGARGDRPDWPGAETSLVAALVVFLFALSLGALALRAGGTW